MHPDEIDQLDDDLRYRLSRRHLLAGAAGAGGALALSQLLPWARAAASRAPLRFLSQPEARTLGAMVDRIFPADPHGPGAAEIGVVHYLDGQLAGAWGHGAGLYADGPHHVAESDGIGYQLALNPRELFRAVLPRVDAYSRTHGGAAFADLTDGQRDDVLKDMEDGKVDLGLASGAHAYSSSDFFESLLQYVNEGLFGDPMYGGNQGAVGWSLIGYPGDPMAYGDAYYAIFGHTDDAYEVKPRGMKAPVLRVRP